MTARAWAARAAAALPPLPAAEAAAVGRIAATLDARAADDAVWCSCLGCGETPDVAHTRHGRRCVRHAAAA